MIDTRGRARFDRLFDRAAQSLLDRGLRPNQVTAAAFVTGLGAGLTLFAGFPWPAAGLLWLSGFFDVVDGSMARQNGTASPLGALWDILSDRVVELAIFWALALRFPQSQLAMLALVSAVLLSMTVFLTTGILAKNTGKKSFYYQSGLMERTEGFIASTAMMLLPQWLVPLTWTYAGLIGITILQRLNETRRLIRETGDEPPINS